MAVNGPVSVQVVGEDQLGATGLDCIQDGGGQRREKLGPSGIRGVCAVIDDGRAGRRAGGLGRVGRVGRHALRTIASLAAAADRPHTPASVHQLGHDGTANGTRRAENHVQRIISLRHRAAPSLAPIVPGAKHARSLLSALCNRPPAGASTVCPVGRPASRAGRPDEYQAYSLEAGP